MNRTGGILDDCTGSIGLTKASIRPRPLSTLGLVLALAGCASLPAPLIPIDEVVKPKEIRVATVLDAARCEIAKGLNEIGESILAEKEKEPEIGDPPFGSFLIYPGTMDFTGTIKVIQTQGAAISAIIPVGTSIVTPSIGYGATQTGTRKIERQFKVSFPTAAVDEKDRADFYQALDAVEDAPINKEIRTVTTELDELRTRLIEARKQPEDIESIAMLRDEVRAKSLELADKQMVLKPLQDKLTKIREMIASHSGIPSGVSELSCNNEVQTNDFISSAIIAQYEDTVKIARLEAARSAQKHEKGPKFQNVKMVITTTFTVSHKPEGGIVIDAVFANPHFTSLGPTANLSQDASDEYTIKLDFPLKRNADPAETRVIVDCKHDVAEGKTICLEAPVSTRDPGRFNAFRETGDADIGLALFGLAAPPEVEMPADPSPVILDSFQSIF